MSNFPGEWFWNPGGFWYIFWSGFGSCLTEFAILGAVWRKLNCHAHRCFRVGLHHVEGTPYVTCRKHHPTTPNRAPTLTEIHEAHAEANKREGEAE